MHTIGLVAAAFALLAAACTSDGSVVAIGDEFTLRAGETVHLEGGWDVALDAVTDDSRCPTDATCIWAGEATVHLRAAGDGGALPLTVVFGPRTSPVAAFDGLALTVLALGPAPRSTITIAPDAYVVTAVVERS